MTRFTKILCLTWLTILGCSTFKWKDQCGEMTRTGFASDLSASRVTIERTPECRLVITIDTPSSEQTEAIRAAAEGAVKGLKP